MPGQVVVVEGVKRVKYAPKLPRIYEKGKKCVPALIDLKIAKKAVFFYT